MKKFIKKLTGLLVVTVTIVVVLNYIYVIACDKGSDTKKFKNVPDSIIVANFGSSHGEDGFYYEGELKENTFNFSLSGQALSYDYQILSQYASNFQKGGTVIIPISYFSLLGPEYSERANFDSLNNRYYSFLDKEHILEYDFVSDVATRFPILKSYYTIFSDIYANFLVKGEVSHDTCVDKTQVSKLAKETAYSHVGSEMDGNGEIRYSKSEIESLKEMISLCNEIEVKPVLITTPYTREYIEAVNHIDPNFIERYTEFVKGIAAETGVEYYDYSCDSRIQPHYEYFRDDDHLNREGAKVFTRIVLEEVVGIEE